MRVINDKLHDDLRLPNTTQCPYCGGKMNTATSYQQEQLEDGDIGICAGCGEINIASITKHGYHLRKLTSDELEDLKKAPIYPTVLQYQQMIRSGNSGLKVKR